MRPLATKKLTAQDKAAIYEQAKKAAEEEGKKLTAQAVTEAVAHYKQRAESAEQTAQQLAQQVSLFESENGIETLVQERVEAQLPQLQAEVESLLSSDYVAKQNALTDQISTLKNDLVKATANSTNALQIQADIAQLEKKRNDARQELARIEQATNQTRVNKIYENLALNVLRLTKDLSQGLQNAHTEKAREPVCLTPETIDLLSQAYSALESIATEFAFIKQADIEEN